MSILLFGCNGQVGWELQRALAPLGQLLAVGHQSASRNINGNFEEPDALARTIRSVKPAVIVNAAAYTAVDQAESEAGRALQINADAVAVVAQEAKRLDALLVHYSTDYVFDGSGEKPWQETDAPNPLNIYGSTKLAGEDAIRRSGCKHLVFRTSWVYAARGKNFVRTMLRLACERDALHVVNDQYGAPTGAELIADVTAQTVRAAANDSTLSGTYHLAAAGETTWHEYARILIRDARELGWPIQVTDGAITPVGTDAFPTPARRPANSRLNCGKIQKTFGLQLPSWRDGVSRVLRELSMPKKIDRGLNQ